MVKNCCIDGYNTALRVNRIGLDGEPIKEIAQKARGEDGNHFEDCVKVAFDLSQEVNKSGTLKTKLNVF